VKNLQSAGNISGCDHLARMPAKVQDFGVITSPFACFAEYSCTLAAFLYEPLLFARIDVLLQALFETFTKNKDSAALREHVMLVRGIIYTIFRIHFSELAQNRNLYMEFRLQSTFASPSSAFLALHRSVWLVWRRDPNIK